MKLLSMVVCLLFCMVGYTTTQAGEWNEKPIMCSDKIETFAAINTKIPLIIPLSYFKSNKLLFERITKHPF